MTPSARRLLAIGAMILVAAVGTFGARSTAGAGLGADTAPFRRQTPQPVDLAMAERDALWRLGRRLFRDPALSKTGRSTCATCHQAGHGWSNAEPRAIGDGGIRLAFKAPTLIDVGSLDRLGWIGRFADVGAVTAFAITSPSNMGLPLPEVSSRLRRDATYADAFATAFGNGGIDDGRIVQALDAYVSSLTLETPFDRWAKGDDDAIDAGAKRGFAIFTGKGRCAECHAGAAFTDGAFHDIGSSTDDLGRGKLFRTSVKLKYAFKTPSLRGVADRSPYLHDGSRTTLEEVVDLYDRGGIDRPSRADVIRPLHLSAEEKADLVAFLKTLSGETRYLPAR